MDEPMIDKDDLDRKSVDWLISHGLSFHQAMNIVSYAHNLALSIPMAYSILLPKMENKEKNELQ